MKDTEIEDFEWIMIQIIVKQYHLELGDSLGWPADIMRDIRAMIECKKRELRQMLEVESAKPVKEWPVNLKVKAFV